MKISSWGQKNGQAVLAAVKYSHYAGKGSVREDTDPKQKSEDRMIAAATIQRASEINFREGKQQESNKREPLDLVWKQVEEDQWKQL